MEEVEAVELLILGCGCGSSSGVGVGVGVGLMNATSFRMCMYWTQKYLVHLTICSGLSTHPTTQPAVPSAAAPRYSSRPLPIIIYSSMHHMLRESALSYHRR